ncbi:hypothetical protein ACG7TL_007202 [Trametes sanguinea]
MPFKSSFLPLPFARDAGRRHPTKSTSSSSISDRINLADYTDPSAPPAPTGWTWSDSMNVWLPADLPVSSGLLFGNPFACNRCRSVTSSSESASPAASASSPNLGDTVLSPTRPSLIHRLTSRENWRLPGEARKSRSDREIVSDGYNSGLYNLPRPAVVQVPAASPGSTSSSLKPQGAARAIKTGDDTTKAIEHQDDSQAELWQQTSAMLGEGVGRPEDPGALDGGIVSTSSLFSRFDYDNTPRSAVKSRQEFQKCW